MFSLILGAVSLGSAAFGAIAPSAAPSGSIASSNNQQLALALNCIIEIAKASPFQELANLASVRAAVVKLNHEWTF